jgi:hypothetical protein
MVGIDIKAMLLNNAASGFLMPNNIKIQVTIFQNNVIVWDNVRQDVTAQSMTLHDESTQALSLLDRSLENRSTNQKQTGKHE